MPLPPLYNASVGGASQLCPRDIVDCSSPYFIYNSVLLPTSSSTDPPWEYYLHKTRTTHYIRNNGAFPVYMDCYKIVSRNNQDAPGDTHANVLEAIESFMGQTQFSSYSPFSDQGGTSTTHTSLPLYPYNSAVSGYNFQRQFKILSHKTRLLQSGATKRLTLKRRWSSSKPIDRLDEANVDLYSIYKGNVFMYYRFYGVPLIHHANSPPNNETSLSPFIISRIQSTVVSFRLNSDQQPNRVFSSSIPAALPDAVWDDVNPSHVMATPQSDSAGVHNPYGNTPQAIVYNSATDVDARGALNLVPLFVNQI